MSSGNNISDPRVLAILNGGESFKRRIDPEGLLRNGCVREIQRVSHSDGSGSDWKSAISFPTGDILYLGGMFNSALLSIHSCRLSCGDKSAIDIPVLGGFSLLAAFGDLSRLPHQLKRNLASYGPENKSYEGAFQEWGDSLFSLERNSLFWSVEMAAEHSKKFCDFRICYQFQQSAFPVSVTLSSHLPLAGGDVIVETSVDIYGLGGKKVRLESNLGSDGKIRCTCERTTDRGRIPSVDVAMELYGLLSDGGRMKERRKKMSMGRPKMTVRK